MALFLLSLFSSLVQVDGCKPVNASGHINVNLMCADSDWYKKFELTVDFIDYLK